VSVRHSHQTSPCQVALQATSILDIAYIALFVGG